MTREELSYAMRVPWLALFFGLTFIVAALVARFVAEPANQALRRRSSTERWSGRGVSEPSRSDQRRSRKAGSIDVDPAFFLFVLPATGPVPVPANRTGNDRRKNNFLFFINLQLTYLHMFCRKIY